MNEPAGQARQASGGPEKPALHTHTPAIFKELFGHAKTQSAITVLPWGDVVPEGHTTQAPFPVVGLYRPAGHAHGPKAESSSKCKHPFFTTNRYLPTALQFTVTDPPLPLGVNAHCVFNAELNVDPSPTLMLAPSKRSNISA